MSRCVQDHLEERHHGQDRHHALKKALSDVAAKRLSAIRELAFTRETTTRRFCVA